MNKNQKPTQAQQAGHVTQSFNQQKVNKLLLVLLVITFALVLGLVGLVLDDIQAGYLRGTPETGWGMLIAFLIVGPLLLLSCLTTLFVSIRSRSRGQKIGKTVKMAGLIALGLLAVYAVLSQWYV